MKLFIAALLVLSLNLLGKSNTPTDTTKFELTKIVQTEKIYKTIFNSFTDVEFDEVSSFFDQEINLIFIQDSTVIGKESVNKKEALKKLNIVVNSLNYKFFKTYGGAKLNGHDVITVQLFKKNTNKKPDYYFFFVLGIENTITTIIVCEIKKN